MDCSPPGSLVHGIFQAWILEWVAIPFSRGSSWPRDRTQVSCIVSRCFTVWATREGPSLVITAAAAKSLHLCPTLCNPTDGSPPGPAVPGILQARTLEWVAISFSNAWRWKVKVKSLSHYQEDANQNHNKIPLYVSQDGYKKRKRKVLVKMWRNFWWECKTLHSLWKIVWQFLKGLHTELPYDLTKSSRNENIWPYKDLDSNVHSSIIHNCPKE